MLSMQFTFSLYSSTSVCTVHTVHMQYIQVVMQSILFVQLTPKPGPGHRGMRVSNPFGHGSSPLWPSRSFSCLMAARVYLWLCRQSVNLLGLCFLAVGVTGIPTWSQRRRAAIVFRFGVRLRLLKDVISPRPTAGHSWFLLVMLGTTAAWHKAPEHYETRQITRTRKH